MKIVPPRYSIYMKASNAMVEILDGLEEGDIVVRDASLDLREGQKVRASGLN